MNNKFNKLFALPRRAVKKGIRVISKIQYKKKEEACNADDIVLSHVTYYKVGNCGDTVLSQCVRQSFRHFAGKVGFRLYEVNRSVNQDLINSINSTPMCVVGGGGLFLPDTNANKISGWQWAISQKQLSQISSPLVLFAVGYNFFPGQINSDLFVESVNAVCRKADFIGIRNHGSIQAIREILTNDLKEKVQFQPCATTLVRRIYNGDIPSKVKTNRVAFNVAFDREERRYGERFEDIMNQIAVAAKQIEGLGYDIDYVCHCPQDARFLKYLKRENVAYKLYDMTDWVPSRVYKFYNNIECVIGMRGHAQMIPFGLNCKILSLGTHNKMKWFLEDIDAIDWYIDLQNDFSTIAERILFKFRDACIDNAEDTTLRIIKVQNEFYDITKSNMQQIEAKIQARRLTHI